MSNDKLSQREEEALRAIPESVPSIVELKRKLPSHCFQPSIGKSFYYVGKDLAIIFALYVCLLSVEISSSVPNFVKASVLPVYWYLQVHTSKSISAVITNYGQCHHHRAR